MVFSSVIFLFIFLPIVLLAYYLVRGRRAKNIVLVIASFFFYYWGEGELVVILAVSVLINYVSGLLLAKTRESRFGGKPALAVGIILNLALLGYFKYFDFVIQILNSTVHTEIALKGIVLPIGISFFTFQGMTYIIDLYRGRFEPQKNLLKLALYVVAFPQMIAGPIVRYKDINEMIDHREESVSQFTEGISRFICGLAKKVLIANNVAVICDAIFAAPVDTHTAATLWIGALTYTFQIYFDFSGYSDMAIGLGRMFGIRIIENFDYPFIAKNITEFWRRWHISLGLWLRDYIYIPMGGNRKRQMLNVFVVWFLIGFLQGAAWNFIFWGVFFVIIIMIEKKLLNKTLPRWPRVFQHLYMIVIVMISFMFFRNYNIFQSTSLIGPLSLHYLRSYALIVVVAMIASTPIPKKIFAHKWIRWFEPIAVGICLILATSFLATGNFNPLIYARF